MTETKIDMSKRHPCPCCGNYTFIGDFDEIAYDICPVCFWELDSLDYSPERYSSPNHITVAQGRENYQKFGACDKQSIDCVRKPNSDELPENNGETNKY